MPILATSSPTHSQELATLAEAARRTGASVASIRRAVKAGKVAGARQDGPAANGPWLLPLASLAAAGFTVAEASPVLTEASLEHARLEADLRLATERCAHLEALVARLDRSLAEAHAREAEASRLLAVALEGPLKAVRTPRRGAA